jgi:hypothetical protein
MVHWSYPAVTTSDYQSWLVRTNAQVWGPEILDYWQVTNELREQKWYLTEETYAENYFTPNSIYSIHFYPMLSLLKICVQDSFGKSNYAEKAYTSVQGKMFRIANFRAH